MPRMTKDRLAMKEGVVESYDFLHICYGPVGKSDLKCFFPINWSYSIRPQPNDDLFGNVQEGQLNMARCEVGVA